MRNVILKNQNNEIARVFKLEKEQFEVVLIHDTNRLELVSDSKNLEASKTEFTKVAEGSLSGLKSKKIKVSNFGHLCLLDEKSNIAPSFVPDKESDEPLKTAFKWSSISNFAIILLMILIGYFLKPSTEEEVVVVTIQETQKPRPKNQKVVMEVSKKKIQPTKKVITKTPPKKVNSHRVVKSNRKTGPKTPTTARIRTTQPNSQLGALGALQSLNAGSKNASGVHLGMANSNAKHIGAAGGQGIGSKTALFGKALQSSAPGMGSPLDGTSGVGNYGTRGTGGGKQGYGKVAINGSSSGYLEPLSEEAFIEGGLDEEQVAAVINRNLGQVIYCYEKGLQTQPSLAGRVSVKFEINGSGQVGIAGISNSSLKSSSVEGCIVQKLKAWKFPKPVGQVTVRVNYPFVLKRHTRG